MDGDKSLVIKNVVPSDEGIYVCEAQNSVGQITSKAQLLVNCEYIYICVPIRLSLMVVYCGVSSLNCPSWNIDWVRHAVSNEKQFKVHSYYNFSTLSPSLARCNGHINKTSTLVSSQ